ncbi:bifunctional DNA primase/polymerase [uncultured Lactobacillus sp.]|uniref:bifunctional DNA primase/polymerase n=1 Tax=uncultured Lactobacillus sp. TaxID=153152 RepID=UPI0025D9AD0F|nr:bifunctional DNA primase/polymerase [uncultured Lactobacillus sp.]
MTLENLVNYAISYASHGFSVIPIGATKRPLIKFANKPPLTIDEIKHVWRRYPLANIALKTDKFFVIDVDRHGDVDGMDAIKKLNHNEWFKGTLTERTAHDGFHFFFQKPKNETIAQNIGFLPGVDLKAHENNYVVVAPSQINGKHYKWLNHDIIRPAPEGLLELIKEKAKPEKRKILSYKVTSKTQTTHLFEKIANGLGDDGQRNKTLASFVGGLLYRGVDPDVVAKLAIIANTNTTDSLPLNEVERTVNSMIEKEIARRGIE